MEISIISSYLILPGKHVENPPQIRGTNVPLIGPTFNLLNDIFQHAEIDCNIPICFLVEENEEQRQNIVRNLLIDYLNAPSYNNGFPLALRLQAFTTKKPGPGLLFIVYGFEGKSKKILISRFPADQGILAEERGEGLEIEFVERVFMKNRNTYKSALYKDSSFDNGFWRGFATDKQINNSDDISQYWIRDFLKSDFFTTSIAGTSRFANAIKEASKSLHEENQKSELIALSTLITSLEGQNLSVNDVFERFNTSDGVKNEILSKLPSSERAGDVFCFNREEFLRNAPYRTIELDNKALITAPTEDFERVITKENVDVENKIVKLSSEGKILNEYLKGR